MTVLEDNVNEEHIKIEAQNLTSEHATDIGENVFIQEQKLTRAPNDNIKTVIETEKITKTETHHAGEKRHHQCKLLTNL